MKTVCALVTVLLLTLTLSDMCQAKFEPVVSQSVSPTDTPSRGTIPQVAQPDEQKTPPNLKNPKTEPKDVKDAKGSGGVKTDDQKDGAPSAPEKAPPSSVVRCAIYTKEGTQEPSSLAKLNDIKLLCGDVPPQGSANQDTTARDMNDPQIRNNPVAGLGTDVLLWVTLNKGKIMGDDGEIGIDSLRLFLNEIQIDDSKFYWIDKDDSNAIVRVKLDRPLSAKTAWNQILAQGLGYRLVRVTVGADRKKPLQSRAQLGLYLLQFKWYFWAFAAALIVIVLIFFTNQRFQNMLRDDGFVKEDATAAFSLSRVQMAYWFALTIIAYAFIWGITGDRDMINNDILALIGISAGTFLGAVSIDAGKKSQAQSSLPTATANLVHTENTVAALAAPPAAAVPVGGGAAAAPASVPSADPATVALAKHAVTIQQQALYRLGCQAMAPPQKNFLSDILSDETGISFHRFQIVAWNLVLGIIFIQYVCTTLSMPTFGNTLLGLMGISGGTYLGFKFPEQKTP